VTPSFSILVEWRGSYTLHEQPLEVARKHPRWRAFMLAAWPLAITGLAVPQWDAAAAVVSPARNWARR